MKKMMLALCLLLVITLAVTPLFTSAVNEGNKLFVDPIEDNSTLYYEKSDLLRYELNIDTGNTLYVKVDENRSPSTTEYIVYKMKDSVVNVEIDCMHCAGLGNGNTDISVFVSKDAVEWVEVETAATEQTFDDDIYISQDTAYWFLSTVYNVEPIEQGYTFIKIQINPFTVKGSVPWNTVIDTIRIEYGPNSGATDVDPTEPTTQPTDPTTQPTEPTTQPTDPTTQPTDPTTQPTDPTTQPTDPTTQPTDPTTQPTDPEPTDPEPTDPEPTDPEPTQTQPTQSQPTQSQPTQPNGNNETDPAVGIWIWVGVCAGIAVVVVVVVLIFKKKK